MSRCGQDFLRTVLNIFVKKNPEIIADAINLANPSDKNPVSPATPFIARAAQYGYDWDYFISQRLLNDPSFLHFPSGNFLPNWQVQAGSAWANIDDLRNFPLTRLYVTENGALIFDDRFSAWGFGSTPQAVTCAITPDDIRKSYFGITDDDVITTLVVMPLIAQIGQLALASQHQFGQPYTLNDVAIKRYGFRYQQFNSQWDTPQGAFAFSNIRARMGVLFEMHNDMHRAQLTVKGNARYRVGQRVVLQYADVNGNVLWGPRSKSLLPASVSTGGGGTSTKQQVWYVSHVAHEGHDDESATDWTTLLDLRFPFAVSF